MAYLRARRPGVRLSGLDASTEMVRLARNAQPEAQIVVGDLATLPFDAEQFGGVLAWYSIIHSPPADLAQVFAEVHRVLRPGGKALFAFQSGTGSRTIANAYGHDVELQAFLHSTSELTPALRTARLEVDTVLDRPARDSEKYPQGFIIAARA